MAKQPFLVKPVSSAADKDIVTNITTNMDVIPQWAERCKKTNGHAFIISAGPSTDVFLSEYKHLLKKDTPIFCIKHTLPKLKEAGVKPTFCAVLDPRPIDQVSTLGFKRSDLYDCAPKSTVFFVASMTHPSVTKHLQEKGYKIVGWHALTPEMQLLPNDYKKRMGQLLITGGTSSGTRSIELSFFLGITSVTCVGFDSSFNGPKPTDIKDHKGKQRYMRITVGKDEFYTTGELVAQAQDFERLISNVKHASDVRIFDTGLKTSLVNALVDAKGNKSTSELSWKKYLSE